MKKELIIVSKVVSTELFKSMSAHIDNNPLMISRFDYNTGFRISTNMGSDLSQLVSMQQADYYFVRDLTVHQADLRPADIVVFVLKNAHLCINHSNRYEAHSGIGLILFDYIVNNLSGPGFGTGFLHNLPTIDTFP
jgi:hypothetical protein